MSSHFNWTHQSVRSGRVELQGRQAELRRSEPQDAQAGINGQQLAADFELPTRSDGDRPLASRNEAGKVAQAAREIGVKIPAMIRIPAGEEIPSAGW